jgi:hypothetical protein
MIFPMNPPKSLTMPILDSMSGDPEEQWLEGCLGLLECLDSAHTLALLGQRRRNARMAFRQVN